MAVAIRTTDFPGGSARTCTTGSMPQMDVANNPPEGMIFHWVGEVGRKVDDHRRLGDAARHTTGFRDERLFPAIQKVSGMDPASGPQPTITEFAVHNYVKP